MALCLKIPDLTIFAPSSNAEMGVMLRAALDLEGPSAVRYPKGAARQAGVGQVGSGLQARQVLAGGPEICLLAIGKMVEAAEDAAALLAVDGIEATVWDVRVVRPLDPAMIGDAARHQLVVTIEDGVREGGAGAYIAQTLADRALATGSAAGPAVVILGTPTAYIPHGKPAAIHAQLGLDGPGIAGTAARVLRARQGVGAPAVITAITD
jgi:1-deoxy-D-xylulose-5-phosphate synthase